MHLFHVQQKVNHQTSVPRESKSNWKYYDWLFPLSLKTKRPKDSIAIFTSCNMKFMITLWKFSTGETLGIYQTKGICFICLCDPSARQIFREVTAQIFIDEVKLELGLNYGDFKSIYSDNICDFLILMLTKFYRLLTNFNFRFILFCLILMESDLIDYKLDSNCWEH